MREVERSAASVEEAIEAALAELGVTEQEATVEILEEPQKGLLGIGSRGAKVRVRAKGEAGVGPSAERDAKIAEDFLTGLLERMELDAEVDHQIDDGVMYVDVFSSTDPDAMGLLIGRRGATLDAIQDLTRAAVQRNTGERTQVVVDVEEYRKRRRAQLQEKAQELGDRVKKSGKPERLEPMSAFERKIVHDAVAEMGGGLESSSEGEDPSRRVVIRKR